MSSLIYDDILPGACKDGKQFQKEAFGKETVYILSTNLKKQAGFGKGGEKNYPGIITGLQMKTYLVISDFKRRENKRGEEYGIAVSVMLSPEKLWRYDKVTKTYLEKPFES